MSRPDTGRAAAESIRNPGNRLWSRMASSRGVMISAVVFNTLLTTAMWVAVLELTRSDRQESIRIAVARNDNLATAFEQYVLRTIESAEDAINYLIREYSRRGAKLELASFIKTYTVDGAALTGIVLSDERGNALTTANGGNSISRLTVADREHFRVHINGDSSRLFIGKPVVGRVTGRMVIPITKRINKADGAFGGVAMALVEPSRLTDVMRDTRLSSLDLMSVVGLDGITRARLTGTLPSSGEDIRKSPLFDEQAKNPVGHYAANGALDGVLRHFSYRTLKDYKVMVTVGFAESEILKDFYVRQTRYLSAAALVTALLAVFTFLLVVALREQRRSAALIARSQTRFLATFDQAAVGIAHCRLDGSFMDVNQKLCDMLGYSMAEFRALKVSDITHPDDMAASRQLLNSLLTSPQGTSSEYWEKRYRHKNGSTVWGALSVCLIADETGKPDFYAAVTQDISERKRIEAALQRSEERYRTTLDSLSEGCQLLGFDWCYLYLNDAAASHYRRPNEDLLGRSIMEAWPGIETSDVYALLRRSMDERVADHREIAFAFPDGSKEWFEFRCQPVPEGIFVLSIRIDERRRAEQVVKRFAAIVESSDDAIIAKNMEGMITDWNPAAEAMFGYAAGEIIGRHISVLIPTDRADEEQMIMASIRSGQHVRHYETLRRHKDGRHIPVSLTISPLRGPHDEHAGATRIVGASKIVRDISARLRAEEVLQAHERERHRLAEQVERERTQLVEAQQVANVGSWETELAGLSVSWSAQTFRIFEVDPAHFHPTHLRFVEMIHPDDRAMVDAAFIASLDKRTPCSVEHRIVVPDGRIKIVEERWQVFHDDQGQPLRAAGTCQDITQRKHAEQALRVYASRLQAVSRQLLTVQESERRLLARELHDTVGQQLAALNLNLGLIAAAIPGEVAGRLGSRLDDSQMLLEDATGHLRNVMRELRPAGLDELGLLAALKEHAQRVARRSEFDLTVNGCELEPRLDPTTEIALFRIVQEALNNVAKHAMASEIVVDLRELEGVVRLSVVDNGRGFDTALRPMIGPHGMGLTTMRERAEAVGGHCWIQSERDKGTTIVVEVQRTAQMPFN